MTGLFLTAYEDDYESLSEIEDPLTVFIDDLYYCVLLYRLTGGTIINRSKWRRIYMDWHNPILFLVGDDDV